MFKRRKGGSPADPNDSAGWTVMRTDDGTWVRIRAHPERIDRLSDHHRAILTMDARDWGMTLLEYVGWVGSMPNFDLHVFRDRVRLGSFSPEVYDAWMAARIVVTETQFLQRGYGPGEPDRWV